MYSTIVLSSIAMADGADYVATVKVKDMSGVQQLTTTGTMTLQVLGEPLFSILDEITRYKGQNKAWN